MGGITSGIIYSDISDQLLKFIMIKQCNPTFEKNDP